MPIVGFSFITMDAKRKNHVRGKVDINNNMRIVDLEPRDLSFTKGQAGVNFKFDFISTYEPNIGTINLTGEVIFMDSDAAIQSLIDNWKKSQKVDKDVMSQILNHALTKCNIQALLLSQELNLPPPIMLPKVKVEEPKKK